MTFVCDSRSCFLLNVVGVCCNLFTPYAVCSEKPKPTVLGRVGRQRASSHTDVCPLRHKVTASGETYSSEPAGGKYLNLAFNMNFLFL